MIDNESIGVGLLTCNRAAQFQKLYSSVSACLDVDRVVVVKNKDFDYGNLSFDEKTEYIHEPEDLGIGHCKNLAISRLLKSGCKHIFLIEDDITIKDQNVFKEYVETAKAFNLEHLIFGSVYTPPSWKLDPVIATFENGSKKLDIYPNLHGGFVYFAKRCLEMAGLFDEKNYINAVEHIDHTYRIIQMGLYTPFWRFADIHDSGRYLQDEQPSNPSTINTKTELQKQRTSDAFAHFAATYGRQIGQIPRMPLEAVSSFLKKLSPNTKQLDVDKKTIKCFAIDHRNTNGKWNFSWTRVGTGFYTDAVLKDTTGETICTERFNSFLGEWTAMWWIWKNLKDLGNPDFVGMTQYRRYFTSCKPNFGPFPIANYESAKLNSAQLDALSKQGVLSPDQLLKTIQWNGAEGILPTRFPDFSYCNGCNSVQDLMIAESNFLKLRMTRELVDVVFNNFKNEAIKAGYSAFQVEESFKQTNTFHFNMFVLSREDFNTYMTIIHSAVMESIKYIDDNNIAGLHTRLFGYVIERLSSCMFFIFIDANKRRFLEIAPLLLPKEEIVATDDKTKIKQTPTSEASKDVKETNAITSETVDSIPKYSFLTFIMGENYELVHEIQNKRDDVEYILVTDNKNLKSDTWKVVYDERLLQFKTPFERCFRVRYNAFDYISTDICITVDGSMEIKGNIDPVVREFVKNDYDICLMPHPFRYEFSSEYQAWVKQRGYPPEKAKKFFELLKISNYDPNFKGLIQLCFSIKKRGNKKSKALDDMVFSFLEWLSVDSDFERLDQTVYSFVLNTWFKDMKILPVSEQIVRSEAIQWYCHNSTKKNMNFFMTPGKTDRRWVLNKGVECLQLLNGKVAFPSDTTT